MILVAAVAASVVAVAVNVATGGSSLWFPPVEAHPLRWAAGGTAAVAWSGLLVWWAQRVFDRWLAQLVPAEQRPEPWVVDRPQQVKEVVAALCRRGGATVGITTLLQGAGGFGKTTVAKLVRADRRVLRRFNGGIYWVTLGRDVRTAAAIVEKVNDLIARIDPGHATAFADPQQAGEHLAALMATGPRRLLILDDVWHPEQEAAFPVGGRRSARLVTTRIPSLVAGQAVAVPVDRMTPEQAKALLTAGLSALPPSLVEGLLAVTWRWALLLRLVNKVLLDQSRTEPDVADVARQLLRRLRDEGAWQLDRLTGAVGHELDADDPRRRQLAVVPTIEASIGMLTPEQRTRFTELAIFAEDEVVPVDLVGALWRASGGLDVMITRRLCARLADLALLTISEGSGAGRVGLHDVVRDYLRAELGAERLAELHRLLLDSVAEGLPDAAALVGRAAGSRKAWWELPESASYLWDHLVEHLSAGERVEEAEDLASDLRWVAARLEMSGPTAPVADLALIDTGHSASLQRPLGQAAHLLAPTTPAHSRLDILFSRVAHDEHWGPQVAALTRDRAMPRLANRWPLPDLPHPALQRSLNVEARVLALAPDGRWLATVSSNGLVQVWKVISGIRPTAFAGPSSPVRAMAVAPDGTWLATSSHDRSVRIWDVASGSRRITLPSTCPVYAMAAAPDGTWLATGGLDGVVRIWDVATGRLQRELVGHCSVRAVAVAPDGEKLVSASLDGTVRIWDPGTGRVHGEFTGHTSQVRAVTAAPDRSLLATGGVDGVVRTWDVLTGTPSSQFVSNHTVRAVAAAADGTSLAEAGADGMVRIWSLAAGHRRAVLESAGSPVRQAMVTGDGKVVVATGFDGVVRAWGVTSGRQWATLEMPAGQVSSMALASGADWLAAVAQDQSVWIWAVLGDRERRRLMSSAGLVRSIAAAPDGSWLATGGFDGVVRLWDVVSGRQQRVFTGSFGPIHSMAIAPDGSWLATGGSDGMIRTWDVDGGAERGVLGSASGPISSMVVAQDSASLVVTSANGSTVCWDVPARRRRVQFTGRAGSAHAAVMTPHGTWQAIGDFDGSVRVWEVETGSVRAMMRVEQEVRALAWTPDGKSLVVGTINGLSLFDFQPGAGGAPRFGPLRPGPL